MLLFYNAHTIAFVLHVADIVFVIFIAVPLKFLYKINLLNFLRRAILTIILL